MMIKLISQSILFVLMCASFLGHAQSFKKINYTNQEIDNSLASFVGTAQIQASSYKVYQIDVESIRTQLQGVAKEFEAAFLAEILKQGRAGELAEGMFSSEAGKTFQGMLDVEIARASSGGLNLGIADAMVEQLGRGLPKEVK